MPKPNCMDIQAVTERLQLLSGETAEQLTQWAPVIASAESVEKKSPQTDALRITPRCTSSRNVSFPPGKRPVRSRLKRGFLP